MRVNPQLAYDRLPIYAGRERRTKPRIYEPFWATVQGIDSRDREFEISTQLVNLSVLGLYMKLAHSIEPGTNLGAIIQFSTTPTNGVDAPRVAIEGVVLRIELKQRGAYGVALEFTHYRFL
jgi:hypothetical protein